MAQLFAIEKSYNRRRGTYYNKWEPRLGWGSFPLDMNPVRDYLCGIIKGY